MLSEISLRKTAENLEGCVGVFTFIVSVTCAKTHRRHEMFLEGRGTQFVFISDQDDKYH